MFWLQVIAAALNSVMKKSTNSQQMQQDIDNALREQIIDFFGGGGRVLFTHVIHFLEMGLSKYVYFLLITVIQSPLGIPFRRYCMISCSTSALSYR